ncbi:M20 family metallopeptidase [Corynebacterium sp.]|uniref:M20 family metallopeptidase n=1 Tax=Corynebacterium sp. TaxID=1720 RepID=UPI003B3A8974
MSEELKVALKGRLKDAIAAVQPDLVALSEWLHAHPETAWQEHASAARCASFLRDRGFEVTENFVDLETSFHATYGSGAFRLALMAEYDALPNIGHACGHNLIAAMSLGAAVALAPVADELGVTVEVFGTPAEEGGGGKIEMLDRGAFDGLDFAMMVHPAPVDVVRARPFAVEHWEVTYTGQAAHAASYPTEGVNAADAFTVAEVGIALLRQQLPPSVRVHGIVTHGGDAPNAIPGRTRGRWYVRANDMQQLKETGDKVKRCFEAGALATGCEVEIRDESKPYSDFRTADRALRFYEANALALGRELHREGDGPEAEMCRASTDMANVSWAVPAIHPYIGVGSYPVLNHQAPFADACVGQVAEQALSDGAVGLAWTAVDVVGAVDTFGAA